MKYTVVSAPFADAQLATIWLRAKNREEVTNASNQIESMLRCDAHQMGRIRPDGLRADPGRIRRRRFDGLDRRVEPVEPSENSLVGIGQV
jgi:hypothetical protein